MKRKRKYTDGRFFEGEWKNKKKKEREFFKIEMKTLLKASLKMVYMKEKELKNISMRMFLKAS